MKKKKNPYKGMSKVFLILIFLAIGIWTVLFNVNNMFKSNTVSSLLNSVIDLSSNTKEEISFLIAGTNENLTDTIIYGKYNTKENQLYLMSIPRDTYIDNPKCIGNKINSLYRGKNLEAFLQEIENLLSVKIDYYGVFDSKLVIEVVDAVGGVEIDVPQRMYYIGGDPQIVIDLKKGVQVLNGKKAEQFLRYRTGYANADLGRVEAQREFIKAFIKTILKPTNIKNIPKVIKISLENMSTNATTREIMKYSSKIREIDIDNVISITMPNSPKYIDGLSYVIADKIEARRIIKEDWNKQTQEI
ncbi:MAG: LCP family protein [Clostridia bacterium]|nr:LCP family protein [Clostridia bacterium]